MNEPGMNAKLDTLIEAMWGLDSDTFWGGMTCEEVEALADVMAEHNRRGQFVADAIIERHGLWDDDEDDLHHEFHVPRAVKPV